MSIHNTILRVSHNTVDDARMVETSRIDGGVRIVFTNGCVLDLTNEDVRGLAEYLPTPEPVDGPTKEQGSAAERLKRRILGIGRHK